MTYYTRAGESVSDPTPETLTAMFNDKSRRVGRTETGGYLVSTIHLVIDHNFGSGPPLIFETMVFKDGELDEEYTARYSTEAESAAGHENIVGMVTALAGVASD